MNESKSTSWVAQGSSFFGAVTASLSHEVNNVLAVVNELAGLIADLSAAAGHGKPIDPDRIRQVCGRIAVRIEDGKGFVKQLNRFAHSTDEPVAKLDARESLEQMVDLCQRFARLQKVELSIGPGVAAPIQGSPFDLLHVFFRTIQTALGMSNPGSTLTLDLAVAEDDYRLRASGVRREPAAEETDARLSLLEGLAKGLGGRAAIEPGSEPTFVLELALPANLCPLTGFEPTTTAKEA